jgi:saccharopine dehydrogenase (NAD+, L-lysine-forming)|tara:strand:- start:1866 stop:2969 length:1104 start_codon:yes stop_codon:yes gene_type:complete
MKISILGFGNIGKAIYQSLCNILEGGYDLKVWTINVFDGYEIEIHKDIEKSVPTNKYNYDIISNIGRFEKELIQDSDIVINALPYQYNQLIVDLCSKYNKHYFGLTEDYESLPKWESKSVFMPQCGLAPGVVSIIAQDFIKDYETIENVKMRVGALPRYTDNKLKYAWTWNTDGLVNEYYKQALILDNGELKQVEPLTELEEISIDGEFFQAFHTAGGIGTLAHTYANQSEENKTNINYKTIRYFGHHDYITFMKNDLGMSQDEMHSKLLEIVPYSNQDVVVLYVYVDGIQNSKKRNDVYFKKFFPIPFGWSGLTQLTAIQYTTAFALTANVELLINNKIKETGHVTQEMISFSDFIETKSGKYFKL